MDGAPYGVIEVGRTAHASGRSRPRLRFRYWPQLVALLLAVLIARECWQTIFKSGYERSGASLSLPSTRGILTGPDKSLVKSDIQSIVKAHPFGGEPRKIVTDTNRLPLQSEDVLLRGTIATDDRAHGIAIVVVGGVTRVLNVGDIIKDSSLQYVYTNHVILNRRGQAFVLFLSPSQTSVPQSDRDAEGDVGIATQGLRNIGDIVIARASTNDAGAVQGFYIEPSPTSRAFYDFGLHPEDFVIAVNGVTVMDPNRAHSEALMEEMRAAKQAVITVVRPHEDPLDIALDISSWEPPTPAAQGLMALDIRH